MRLKKINLTTQLHLGTIITSLLTYIFTATSLNTNVVIQASLCGKCDRSKCPIVENCPGDVVLDHCRCCSQCAKIEGEKCGGQIDKCSGGLVCVISPKKGDPVTGTEIGSCTKTKERNTTASSTSASKLEDAQNGVDRLEIDCSKVNCKLLHPKSASTMLCPHDSYLSTPKKTSNSFSTNSLPSSSLSLIQEKLSIIKVEDLFHKCCRFYENETLHTKPTKTKKKKLYKNYFNFKSLLQNCVCLPCPEEQTLNCSSSTLPYLVKPGTNKPGSCCPIYKCMPRDTVCKAILCNYNESHSESCPPDSTEIPLDSPLDICCFKTKGCQCKSHDFCEKNKPKCPSGTVRRVLQDAQNNPGSCCGRYDCIDISLAQSTNCKYGDKTKRSGETWVDGCKEFKCKEGIIFGSSLPCSEDVDKDSNNMSCEWSGREENNTCCTVCKGCVGDDLTFHLNGESWKPFPCIECICQKGQKYCQSAICQSECANPVQVPGHCCPICMHNDTFTKTNGPCEELKGCDLMCVYGYKENEKGCPVCECNVDTSDDFIPPEKCDLKCSTGYVKDFETQTKKCRCRVKIDENHLNVNLVLNPHNHNTSGINTKEGDKKIHLDRCPSLTLCDLDCPYGYKKDLEGCPTCHCNRCPLYECHKRCLNGYQTNNDDCFICKCLPSGPFPGLPEPTISPTTSPIPLLPEHETILDRGSMARHCVSANQRHMEHGQAWWDGCRRCFCHQGYEMCELVICPPVQCSSPLVLPNECCPTCPGKKAPAMIEKSGMCLSGEGRIYVEGETWSLDKCTFCLCHRGMPLCTNEICAPLLCHQPILLPDSCCPICPHSVDHLNKGIQPSNDSKLPSSQLSSNFTDPGNKSCLFSKTGSESKHGDVWRVSACQSCYCNDGVIYCFSQTCPILGCQETVLKKGHCCPSCLDVSVHYCIYNDETYDNRESWMVDDFTTCACMDGHVMCTMSLCPNNNCNNPTQNPVLCCPNCSGNLKENCSNIKSKKKTSQHLNISLITVLIAIIAFLAIAIVVLLIMLLWLRPRLRRSSSLLPNSFLCCDKHGRDHVPLNDEKSVSSSILNSVSANVHPHNQLNQQLINQNLPIKYHASNQTTPKLGTRTSIDGGFDVPSLTAAISSVTTASLASSSSSAAKKRLSFLDGCSGSDEKAISSETPAKDLSKTLDNSDNLNHTPPLPPRRPHSFRTTHSAPYTQAVTNSYKDSDDDEDDDREDDEMLPPPLPPNHPDDIKKKEKEKLRNSWPSGIMDQSSNFLNNHDDDNDNRYNVKYKMSHNN